MTKWTAFALLVSVLVAVTFADVYIQSPSGSNNRLNGKNRDRQNANRLFDSQNNARGGYNAQGVSYYAGSVMHIEWTNQHQCGGDNTNCELILQYMCGDKVRNGITEKTIPQDLNDCENDDCNNDLEYGMHENYEYYESCFIRERNKGLYTADQNMDNRNTARYTRQDNNGNRYGYECNEERDYYPYWGPTPWKDIVVMTGQTERCDYYKKHSQNVEGRSHCVADLSHLTPDAREKGRINNHFRQYPVPISKEKCADYSSTYKHNNVEYEIKAEWKDVDAHKIGAPDCIKSPYSRDNHHGNGIGGFPNHYNWTVPEDIHESCVLRIRYNISTGEFPWNTDYKSNGRNRNNQPCKACAVNLGEQLGIDEWEAQDRGFILTGNPDVLLLKEENGEINEKFELKLAVNTDQYGRTFEDRTHIFGIRQRPASVPKTAKIHNLSVRGKRGNIVQTYPAHEYDFVPNRLEIEEGDYIDIRWSGSDDNPNNNAGQGEAGSDRSNMILLKNADKSHKFAYGGSVFRNEFAGHWGRAYPMSIKEQTFLGFSYADAQSLAMAGEHTGGDMEELDEADVTYSLGLRQVTKPGVYRYVCTRNNNFTNRGQKGVIVVKAKAKRDESYKGDKEINEELNAVEADMMKSL